MFTLASRGKDGATMRSHLEVAARRGNASARAKLLASRLKQALEP